jgi:2-polyprenyl-3-methyl-5-hydroxy-6-metoxy-1,4-benzoquinol methylase
MPGLTAQQLYAQLYDLRVHNWPGELDFYHDFLSVHRESQKGVLEIACGTGRVTIPLAQAGYQMTAFDLSPELLDIARAKTTKEQVNPAWVQADMRTFELGRKFGVVISPGHSFQFMNTPQEQVQCLEHTYQHLLPGGWLILHLDHQDVRWLAELLAAKEPQYSVGDILLHPATNILYRYTHYWTYQPSTQTATVHAKWEQIDEKSNIIATWSMAPNSLHCAFRSEIEHLLNRCGFTVKALYGDFYRHPLEDTSENMVWVARKTSFQD